MRRLFFILIGFGCMVGALFVLFRQEFGSALMLGIIGGTFLVLGLAGGNP